MKKLEIDDLLSPKMLKDLKIEELYLRKLNHEQLVLHALSLHKGVYLLMNSEYEMNGIRTSITSNQNQIIRKQKKSLEMMLTVLNETIAHEQLRKVLEPKILAQKIKIARSLQGTNAANAKHKITKQRKTQAYEWFDMNRAKYKTMPDTATAAKNALPISFDTALKYLREWKKDGAASKA
jgi:predicted RNA-binding protein